jgi:S1-C subfamily serine protease
MVVIAGSGHCWYNLGINRRVYEKKAWPYRTVICVIVPKGESSVTVSRGLADYVWGLPEEEKPVYPSIGLRFKKFDHLENLVVERKPIDGVALEAGFKQGDVLLSVAGRNFSDINTLRIFLSEFSWEDQVTFKVLRNAQEKEVVVDFQPPIKKEESSDKKESDIE